MPSATSSSSRLFHPVLESIPLPIRFVISGVTGNAVFLMVYNAALASFRHAGFSASTIFSVVQFGCIILNHWLNVGIVFGWPSKYFNSLMSNMPVGLTSLVLGAWLADRLEAIRFDYELKIWMGVMEAEAETDVEAAGTLFASLVVMAVTGVYNYVVLNIVNKAPAAEESSKEEAKKDE